MTAASDQPALPPALVVSSALPVSLSNYSYTAQTEHGFRINGSIEAPDHSSAIHVLEGMRLRVIEVSAAGDGQEKRKQADAFLSFNQRLAQLTSNGLPIEEGMRLIALDMRRGRLSAAIAKIAAELKDGVLLSQAFEKHGRLFPPLYGRLIEAGVGGGNLPGVLLDLGRHLEAQQRLSAALWRSVANPAATFCGLLLVTSCIGWGVMPQLETMFASFHLALPAMVSAVIWFGQLAPYFIVIFGTLLAAILIARIILVALGARTAAAERFLLPIPLIGPVLRFNMIARWLDAVRIGTAAGLNPPAAIALAGDCMRSPALRQDGAKWIGAIAAGTPMSDIPLQLLPATVSMTIDSALRRRDLSAALETLCDLYARQTELRLERIPAILTPLLIIVVAIVICVVIGGIVLPLVYLIRELTRF